MDPLMLLAAVLITAGMWLRFVYKLDRIEPEPVGRLLWVGGLGGLLSGLPAGELNVFYLDLAGISLQEVMPFGEALGFSLYVGVNEEFWKLLATLLLVGWSSKFDEPADGVVFATTVALGFAAFENLDYGLESGVGVLMLRSVTAMPLHLGVAALWGYGLARWKFMPRASFAAVLPWYILSALLHAAYDFILFASPPEYGLPALALGAGLSWLLIRLMRKRLNYLVAQSPFVRGGYCTSCGFLNLPAERKCVRCLASLDQEFFKICEGCGAKLGWAMKYCPRCGTQAPHTDV